MRRVPPGKAANGIGGKAANGIGAKKTNIRVPNEDKGQAHMYCPCQFDLAVATPDIPRLVYTLRHFSQSSPFEGDPRARAEVDSPKIWAAATDMETKNRVKDTDRGGLTTCSIRIHTMCSKLRCLGSKQTVRPPVRNCSKESITHDNVN